MDAAKARANVLGLRRGEKDIFLNIKSREIVMKYLGDWQKEREHLLAGRYRKSCHHGKGQKQPEDHEDSVRSLRDRF